jgi:hypothetical protein
MADNTEIQMAPLPPHRAYSYGDDKKDDVVDTEVGVYETDEVDDKLHRGRHYIYENIPEGTDLNMIREEKVVRGLSERHIQVSRGCGANLRHRIRRPADGYGSRPDG